MIVRIAVTVLALPGATTHAAATAAMTVAAATAVTTAAAAMAVTTAAVATAAVTAVDPAAGTGTVAVGGRGRAAGAKEMTGQTAPQVGLLGVVGVRRVRKRSVVAGSVKLRRGLR
jgi:hypothetical protein